MPSVYTQEYLDKYEVKELIFSDDKEPDSMMHRNRVAKILRGAGWTVECGVTDLTDLARCKAYWLKARKERRTK